MRRLMQQPFATPAGPLRPGITPGEGANRRGASASTGPTRVVLHAGPGAAREHTGQP